eukprot:m.287013 g.287013  ORF g.287013 m.287013 type:complete len:89 (+) comp15786_c2_seq1:731-997(+)
MSNSRWSKLTWTHEEATGHHCYMPIDFPQSTTFAQALLVPHRRQLDVCSFVCCVCECDYILVTQRLSISLLELVSFNTVITLSTSTLN